MHPAPDLLKTPHPRVWLAAFSEPDLAMLTPTGELLTHFAVRFERTLLGKCTGETPDFSDWASKTGLDGARIVILASRQAGTARALAAFLAVPVIRVPVPIDESPRAALAALTGDPDPGHEAQNGPGAGAFATVAIGEAGARNAALLAVSILALTDGRLEAGWQAYREEQTNAVLAQPAPRG